MVLNGDIKWISKEGSPAKVEAFVSLTKAEGERKDEPNDHR